MTPEQVRAEVRAHADRIQEQLEAECKERHERTNRHLSELDSKLREASLTTTETRVKVASMDERMTAVMATVTEGRDEQRETRSELKRATRWVMATMGIMILSLLGALGRVLATGGL